LGHSPTIHHWFAPKMHLKWHQNASFFVGLIPTKFMIYPDMIYNQNLASVIYGYEIIPLWQTIMENPWGNLFAT